MHSIQNHKRLSIIFSLLIILSGIRGNCQPLSSLGKTAESGSKKSIPSHTGNHLPTVGEIRGLVLYIQTKNDTMDDPDWKLGELPSWWQKYAQTMKEYFLDMSCGQLTLELETYPELLITPFREEEYICWGGNSGDAIRDIFKRLDSEMDFERFDNWNSEGRAYSIAQGGEGKIDLVLAIYRRVDIPAFLWYSGVSDLNFEGYQFVDSMRRYIYGGTGQSNDAASSGLSVTRRSGKLEVTDYEWTLMVSIHELMHKIIGEGHTAEIFGGLGVLGTSGNGLAFNSFERHLLGYMDFKELTPGIDTTITVHDYVTQKEAFLLPIPQADRWYYSFEFRGKKSPYDTAPTKGVYIFRIYDSWGKNQKEVHVVSADGKYRWGLDSISGRPFKLYPDPLSGYNVYQKIPINGKIYCADGWWGDPQSAYTMDKPVFAMYRNPTPDFILRGRDTIKTGLNIYVISMTDSAATLRISYSPPPILSADNIAPVEYSLEQNYPNPVNPSIQSFTTINYSLPHETHIVLNVCDLFGRTVKTLVDSSRQAGKHHVTLNVSDLSSGIYWLVLNANERIIRKPMTVVW